VIDVVQGEGDKDEGKVGGGVGEERKLEEKEVCREIKPPILETKVSSELKEAPKDIEEPSKEVLSVPKE
jgi:hypothetical protein